MVDNNVFNGLFSAGLMAVTSELIGLFVHNTIWQLEIRV
jgi:hypothetical protein